MEGWQPLSAIPYDDETLHSIEAGFKSTWGDGRTRFNGTFFYYDYSDYQAFIFTGVAGVVINADASYSDSFFYNLRNFPADEFDTYTLVNTILGWTSPEEHWDFSIALRNITDEHAGIHGFDLATLCGCNEISFRPPTQAVARVMYSY